MLSLYLGLVLHRPTTTPPAPNPPDYPAPRLSAPELGQALHNPEGAIHAWTMALDRTSPKLKEEALQAYNLQGPDLLGLFHLLLDDPGHSSLQRLASSRGVDVSGEPSNLGEFGPLRPKLQAFVFLGQGYKLAS